MSATSDGRGQARGLPQPTLLRKAPVPVVDPDAFPLGQLAGRTFSLLPTGQAEQLYWLLQDAETTRTVSETREELLGPLVSLQEALGRDPTVREYDDLHSSSPREVVARTALVALWDGTFSTVCGHARQLRAAEGPRRIRRYQQRGENAVTAFVYTPHPEEDDPEDLLERRPWRDTCACAALRARDHFGHWPQPSEYVPFAEALRQDAAVRARPKPSPLVPGLPEIKKSFGSMVNLVSYAMHHEEALRARPGGIVLVAGDVIGGWERLKRAEEET